MIIQTRVDPIDRQIAVMLAADLSPEARSKAIATYARAALLDAQVVNTKALGSLPGHDTFVDGRPEAPLESVKPTGMIVFEFDLMLDLFAWIGEILVQHSPVLTGAYAASHLFFADGVKLEPGENVPPAEEYLFINSRVYARKIERGLSAQAPDGVYQAVAAIAQRRFGNVARVSFAYRDLLGAGDVKDVGSWARGRASGRNRRQQARDVRQPAIVIRRGR